MTEFDGVVISRNEVDDPADGIVEAESLRELYSIIKKNLSDYEYRIWHGYMLGRTARQIGEAIGKDEKSDKLTSVKAYGLKGAIDKIHNLGERAEIVAKSIDLTGFLQCFIQEITNRINEN